MQTLDEAVALARYQHVLTAIQIHPDKREAAKAIGISLATLYRILEDSKDIQVSVTPEMIEAAKPKPPPEPKLVYEPVPPQARVLPIKREQIQQGDVYYHKDTLSCAVVMEINFAREAVRIRTSKGSSVECVRTFVQEYGSKPVNAPVAERQPAALYTA